MSLRRYVADTGMKQAHKTHTNVKYLTNVKVMCINQSTTSPWQHECIMQLCGASLH